MKTIEVEADGWEIALVYRALEDLGVPVTLDADNWLIIADEVEIVESPKHKVDRQGEYDAMPENNGEGAELWNQ